MLILCGVCVCLSVCSGYQVAQAHEVVEKCLQVGQLAVMMCVEVRSWSQVLIEFRDPVALAVGVE